MFVHLHLGIARFFVKLMENQFKIGKWRFGLDPILGLFPGLGDFLSMVLSLYLIWIAGKLDLPGRVISKMIGNIFIDFLLGLPPIVGDLADVAFKANSRNYQLIIRSLKERKGGIIVAETKED